jgi:hypothetical protein
MARPPASNGTANIDKQGQTASGSFGSDPNTKARFNRKPRDLNIK